MSSEKDAREVWIKKYELAEQAHVQTNVELLRVRSLHQNADMDYKNSLISIETLRESKINLEKEKEKILKGSSELRAKNENLEREVYAKTKLLKNVED